MQCSNCESEALRWYVGTQGPSYIADGLLRMSDIQVIAFLGCEECSETLQVIGEAEVNNRLNGDVVA